jgi:hypothetical protein
MCVAFPFNSPLKNMFGKAVMQDRESGVHGNLVNKWMGADINNAEMDGKAELGAGHLILVFVVMMVASLTSFVILGAELAFTRMKTGNKLLNQTI